jgi:hypothetical protein
MVKNWFILHNLSPAPELPADDVRVTLGYVRVTLGYVRVTLGYVRVTLGYVRVRKG